MNRFEGLEPLNDRIILIEINNSNSNSLIYMPNTKQLLAIGQVVAINKEDTELKIDDKVLFFKEVCIPFEFNDEIVYVGRKLDILTKVSADFKIKFK